jgi:exodeoxyribonuclease VII large subunit
MKNATHVYTITEINSLVKDLFDNRPILHHITIKGEISNFKAYPKAFYFSLKDNESQLPAVMFFNYRDPLSFQPKDGDEVIALGTLSVYEKRGYYQLVVDDMIQFGIGIQLIKLQELKLKLEKEGLFLESKKRALKKYPKSIGIIAGNESAAYKDIITNINRRYPLANIFFFPALVQGKQAPDDLIRALSLAYKYPLDTLIIGRGGGSEEDLSAFNDERVVRHIAKSPIPTIGAIGHEINITLADLVCDKRASTPTGAAELATRDRIDIDYEIQMLQKRLIEATNHRMNLLNEQFSRLKEKSYFIDPVTIHQKPLSSIALIKEKLVRAMLNTVNDTKEQLHQYRLELINPQKQIDLYQTQADNIYDRIKSLVTYNHDQARNGLISLDNRLLALSPYQVLERGYSLVTNEHGDIITDSNEVQEGQIITTTLKHGKISSVVKEKKE